MSKVNCSQVILFCFVYVAQEFMFFLFSYIKYIYSSIHTMFVILHICTHCIYKIIIGKKIIRQMVNITEEVFGYFFPLCAECQK